MGQYKTETETLLKFRYIKQVGEHNRKQGDPVSNKVGDKIVLWCLHGHPGMCTLTFALKSLYMHRLTTDTTQECAHTRTLSHIHSIKNETLHPYQLNK